MATATAASAVKWGVSLLLSCAQKVRVPKCPGHHHPVMTRFREVNTATCANVGSWTTEALTVTGAKGCQSLQLNNQNPLNPETTRRVDTAIRERLANLLEVSNCIKRSLDAIQAARVFIQQQQISNPLAGLSLNDSSITVSAYAEMASQSLDLTTTYLESLISRIQSVTSGRDTEESCSELTLQTLAGSSVKDTSSTLYEPHPVSVAYKELRKYLTAE